jgi:hypothetical protein
LAKVDLSLKTDEGIALQVESRNFAQFSWRPVERTVSAQNALKVIENAEMRVASLGPYVLQIRNDNQPAAKLA